MFITLSSKAVKSYDHTCTLGIGEVRLCSDWMTIMGQAIEIEILKALGPSLPRRRRRQRTTMPCAGKLSICTCSGASRYTTNADADTDHCGWCW
jgi:hypothetical protein